MRVGIEVGGTFTDLVAVDGGRVIVAKVPSTPASPDIGAFAALGAAGIAPALVIDLVHGSTVATNAILERKGARIAFVTTRGFRDIPFLQRHDRRNIYDLRYAKPQPPVARRDCFEIGGAYRCDRPHRDRSARRGGGPPTFWSRRWPRAVTTRSRCACCRPTPRRCMNSVMRAMIAAALPDLRVACSHEVAREFREFERASTTVLSAYVQPVIDRYLDRFEADLASADFAGEFSVMQSNGGRLPAAAMRSNAITALFSGPAAGVVGAIRQAGRSGRGNLITFDMGGTSHRRQSGGGWRSIDCVGDRDRRAADSHTGAGHRLGRRRAAAAWFGSTTAECCASARGVPARIPAPPAMAVVALNRR